MLDVGEGSVMKKETMASLKRIIPNRLNGNVDNIKKALMSQS